MAVLAGEIKSGLPPKSPSASSTPPVVTTTSGPSAATPTAAGAAAAAASTLPTAPVDPRSKLETRMAGELTHEEWAFLLQENLPFVGNCLNAVIDQAEIVTLVNTFLQQNLDIAMCCIRWVCPSLPSFYIYGS
jgi:hypothetical protein